MYVPQSARWRSIKWAGPQFPSLLEISWQNFALWPMPGQCYVTPAAKRLINASLFQSSLRRKWSGSTSTNPDKAISLLYTIYSRLSSSGGVEEGGDDSSLFSLFPHFLSRSPPLFFTAFFPPRRPTTPLFCPASITRLRSNSVFPCSSINSETFSSQLSPSCLLFHAVFLNVSIIILRDIRYIILYLFK